MNGCRGWDGRIGIFGSGWHTAVRNFVHLPKVGFDYRVRSDSVRLKAHEHASDLVNYIFGKPEMACYRLVREMDEQARILRTGIRSMENLVRGMQDSRSYRLGQGLTCPSAIIAKTVGRYFAERMLRGAPVSQTDSSVPFWLGRWLVDLVKDSKNPCVGQTNREPLAVEPAKY